MSIASSTINAEFLSYFSEIYGERWPKLLASLMADEVQVARVNQFADGASLVLKLPGVVAQTLAWTGHHELSRDAEGLFHFYVMDPASILCARALAVQSGDRVLDMCAAPGGKTLILAESLGAQGELIANEFSPARRARLTKVIQQYIPRDIRNQVWVTSKDGGLFAKSSPEQFERILVDAPCSGERHLLRSPNDMKEWSEKRSQKLAQRQYALMTAALCAAKAGARIVYSTCSIAPQENDGVIARLLEKSEKKGPKFKVVYPESEIAPEKTIYGSQYFPDQFGFGPIYFAVIEKA